MSLKSELHYVGKLVGAGLNGVASAWQEPGIRMEGGNSVWLPASIGAATGVLGFLLSRNRRSAASLALGGLLGSVLGFSAGMAWASRDFSGTAVRTAMHNVNSVRDGHWLENNPINYA